LDGEQVIGDKINLAGMTLTNNSEFTISGELPAEEHQIDNLIVEFDIETTDIESITGQNFRFNIPKEKFDLEFELPEEFDNLVS